MELQYAEETLRRHVIQCNLAREYDINLICSSSAVLEDLLAQKLADRKVLLVTTPTVGDLYGHVLYEALQGRCRLLGFHILHRNEHSKNLEGVAEICAEAQRLELDRKSVIIGLGGGICTDLVTVAASWFRRGISHIRIPTTLIGQVDAGVGIKGGLNFQNRKSALGCFYPPESVFINPVFLATLSHRHLRSGMAEIVKIALVSNAHLFSAVIESGTALLKSRFSIPSRQGCDLVWNAAMEMIKELTPNFYENLTSQRLVDFGHVFSPFLERDSQFSLPHGYAVAIDMAFTCSLGTELGLLSPRDRDLILTTMEHLGLPVFSPILTMPLVQAALDESQRHRGGAVNLVVPTAVGQAVFLYERKEIPDNALTAALQWLAKQHTPQAICQEERDASFSLVFDIGGTNLRAGLYERKSKTLLRTTTRPTPSLHTLPNADQSDVVVRLLQEIRDVGKEVLGGKIPQAVVVAFPGPVSSDGKVKAAPTIWGNTLPEPLSLFSNLSQYWPSSEIAVLNDVAAAGYRYLSGHESFCIVTVGSGIGAKLFVEGRPLIGKTGLAGEIGHWRVDYSPTAPVCDCGGVGHLGAIASGRGTLNFAQEWARQEPERFAVSMLARFAGREASMGNRDLVTAWHNGDIWTQQVIRRSAAALGAALCMIHQACGIERFVIYGGFALALGEPYRDELVTAADRSGWPIGPNWDDMIQLGKFDDLSGLIGAGRYSERLLEIG